MSISRREIIRLAGLAAVTTPFSGLLTMTKEQPERLFFDPSDLPRIIANAQSPLLGQTFEEWRAVAPATNRAIIERVLETRELLGDLGKTMETIFRETTMLLITGEARHRDLVLRGLEVMQQLPKWDYLVEDGTQVLGLMRASKATTCVLYALEVLGDTIPMSDREMLLDSVAEKGCASCALTISQMDHPEDVVGWGVEEMQQYRYQLDMSRWPTILGHNNLRAIPTMGLGLGALALTGRDPRAEAWLDLAVRSAKTFFGLFEEDGSYFEGISYIDFSFRTLFVFLEAHYRLRGDVDWVKEANFAGITDYIVCLQNGVKEDGTPDVINISDARDSVFPCVSSWIAKRSGDPVAQYAAEHFSNPGFYADFLWFDASRKKEAPSGALLNKKMDLDWIVTRTGWDADDTVIGFRSGPPMNHEHADRNSIMVKAFGERLLTDPFGASYDPQAPRWLLRKTVAHNAILIDGEGHQYHNGEEGTNESKAHARIVAYEDGGPVVSWSSDATQAYQLDRPDVRRVVRSVFYDKRGLIVLVDQLEMKENKAELTVRFHPDNRDGLAQFDLSDKDRFEISRPAAALLMASLSDVSITRQLDILDLPESEGVFPFVDVVGEAADQSTIVTAMTVNRLHADASDGLGAPSITRSEGEYRIEVSEFAVIVSTDAELPVFALA